MRMPTFTINKVMKNLGSRSILSIYGLLAMVGTSAAVDVDIAVTGFTAFQPSPIAAGTRPTSISYALHNYGPGNIGTISGGTGPVLLELWISPNSVLGDGDDLWLGQMQSSISLPAGASSTITLSNPNGLSGFTIPAGANGIYNVFLRVTHPASSGRTDPDLSDNTRQLSGTITVNGVDTTPPTVTSVIRLNPSGQFTPASSVTWRVTFSENVNNVSMADFTLVDVSGTLTGESLTSVSASSGTSVDVTASTGSSGDGDLRLDVLADTATITDDAGNSLNTSFTGGQLYTVDRTVPTVVSINRLNPVGQSTAANSVTWRVTFSENVNNVSMADFTLVDVSGTLTGESLTSVSASSGTSVDVTASTGSSGNGDLRLDVIVPGATITDDAGNALNTSFTSGQVYTINRTASQPHEFTVNTTSDTVDVNPGDGIALDASGDTSLRAAIMEANALPAPATIILPAGRYALTIPGDTFEDASLTGDLDIAGDLTIVGAGAASTTIDVSRLDGFLNGRAFHVLTNAALDLRGVTVTGVRDRENWEYGGAIYNQGTAVLTDCILSDNQTYIGAAAYNYGTMTLTGCVISQNSVGGAGALGNDQAGVMTIVRCSIAENTGPEEGAGIYNWGTLTIIDSTLRDNNAGYYGGGGALYSGSGNVMISGSTFFGNTAVYYGGAISSYGTLSLTNCTVSGNSAQRIGAIYAGGTLTLINSTVTSNAATHSVDGSVGGISGVANIHNWVINGSV